jgi:flagellar biosynthesis chaperone FliJ
MAGKPKPGLQSLLAWRQHQENLAMQHYGEALRNQDETIGRLDSVLQEIQETRALLEIRCKSGASPAELSRLKDRCQFLEKQRLAREHAVMVARNQARLAFTNLMATRYTSALLRSGPDNPRSSTAPRPVSQPNPGHPPEPKQSLVAWLTQAPPQTLWN